MVNRCWQHRRPLRHCHQPTDQCSLQPLRQLRWSSSPVHYLANELVTRSNQLETFLSTSVTLNWTGTGTNPRLAHSDTIAAVPGTAGGIAVCGNLTMKGCDTLWPPPTVCVHFCSHQDTSSNVHLSLKQNCTMLCAFARRLETVHRADFSLLEGNGTIVGVKTGGHADGDVWGYWAVRLDVLCFVELERCHRKQLPLKKHICRHR